MLLAQMSQRSTAQFQTRMSVVRADQAEDECNVVMELWMINAMKLNLLTVTGLAPAAVLSSVLIRAIQIITWARPTVWSTHALIRSQKTSAQSVCFTDVEMPSARCPDIEDSMSPPEETVYVLYLFVLYIQVYHTRCLSIHPTTL